MPIVKFPALMKFYVDNQSEFEISGATVAGVIESVLVRYPALRPHLFDTKGELRRHFNVFVNGIHIRDLAGLETVVKPEDKIIFMASAAGG